MKKERKSVQHPVGLQELAPEQAGRLALVGGVAGVLRKWDRRFHLVGMRLDPGPDTQLGQRVQGLGVEVGYRFGLEVDVATRSGADPDAQLLVDEVEFHVERTILVGDRRGGQASWADVQRHLPPVVDQRCVRQADLADDLCPHVQGVPGRAPVGNPQSWPCSGQACVVHRHSSRLTRASQRCPQPGVL